MFIFFWLKYLIYLFIGFTYLLSDIIEILTTTILYIDFRLCMCSFCEPPIIAVFHFANSLLIDFMKLIFIAMNV